MSVTGALFYIKKNNVLSTDPNNPLFYVQTGQERSKGAEFEFRGSPHPGWNVLTSYAFTQAQVTQSTMYAVGNVLPNAPRHSGAIWTTYQPTTGRLRPLRLQHAGVIATGARGIQFLQFKRCFPVTLVWISERSTISRQGKSIRSG